MADLTIPYGQNAAGHMMAAHNVPRGAACGCVCPGCRRPLIAHQGESERAWHFQHYPDSSGAAFACRFAYETSVHAMAKDVVLANQRLIVPPVMAVYGRYSREGLPAGWRAYTPVGIEVWLPDINRRPDVMVEADGALLAIEIYVAHRSEPQKRVAFAARGLAAVEIDLSGYDRSIAGNEVALTNAVLSSARREWLFAPRKASFDAAYAAEILEAERVAAEKEEARLAAIAEAEQRRQVELAERQAEAARLRVEREARQAAERAETQRQWAERQQAIQAEETRRKAEYDAEVALGRAETLRARATANLTKADTAGTAQRCAVCDRPYSPFGFGDKLWACREHRAVVDAQAVAEGLVSAIPGG